MSLYMFRVLNAHLQEDKLYTCSIWYCHSLREFGVACRCTGETDRQTDKETDRRTDGRTERRGQTNRRTDERMVGRTDGQP